MPLNISKLGKVLKTLNRLEGIKEFNATLPVKIEVKKEIKEYKSKISQILKAEYQVEVEIKKDSIKVVDDVFVNKKLEEIETLQKEIAQLNILKQKLGEYNV